MYKRDLRDSNVRPFGQWITSFDWSLVFEISDCNLKYTQFNDIVSEKINYYFPLKQTKVRKSDKPWIISSLKLFIRKRQRALHIHGKTSPIYKKWRNIVQLEVKYAHEKYYQYSVKKLKPSNPSRWWKELKALGGLSSQQLWYHQLLSDDLPTCMDLAESYNKFLVCLTSHIVQLVCCNKNNRLEVPNHLLVKGRFTLFYVILKLLSQLGLILNKLLKIFAFELAPVISDTYNTSLRNFSSNFKAHTCSSDTERAFP